MIDYNKMTDLCISQIESGINLPFAWFDLGKCNVLQDKAGDSFPAFASAVEHADRKDDLIKMIKELEAVREQVENKSAYDLAMRILKLGLGGKFQDKKTIMSLEGQTSEGWRKLTGATLILAGASGEDAGKYIDAHHDLMLSALKDFFGNIISGGTKQGIGKLAGDIQEAYPKIAFSIGYVPEKLPDNVKRDSRYSEIRTTPGSNFNIMQPVQYWTDIVGSGIDPRTVSIIGIGGNGLSYFEYILGLALGARVAVLQSSIANVRDQAGHMLWNSLKKVVALPEDAYVIRAFAGTGLPPFPDEIRDIFARAMHESYRYSDSDQKSVQSMKN
jgi:hypothetical protein